MAKKYSEVRPTIRSGDLLIWSTREVKSITDFLMQIVRVFTKSEYDHVGVAWVIGERVFVIEAVIPVVRIFPLSSLLPFYYISTNSVWSEETEKFALEQIGQKYSISQAIESFFNKPNLDDTWHCAELVHAIYNKEGIDLGEVYTPSALVLKAMETFDGMILVKD